eukprot:973629-Karenia_brevis.AAC.1
MASTLAKRPTKRMQVQQHNWKRLSKDTSAGFLRRGTLSDKTKQNYSKAYENFKQWAFSNNLKLTP